MASRANKEIYKMESKSIKKNYLFNVAYEILVILTPFVTTPYVSRVLKADNIGKVSYEASIATYFVICSALGTSLYGAREISYVQNDKEKRTNIFWDVFSLKSISSGICILAYIGYVLLLRDGNELSLVMSFNILAVFFDITWLFQGVEEFPRIVARNVIFKILGVVFIFCLVKSEQDIVMYAIGTTLIPMTGNLLLWPFLRKIVGLPSLHNIHPFKNFKVVISLFIPTIAISIYTVLDKTIIGIIDSSGFENGYYEQATKISKMVLTLLTSLGTVVIPRIGYFYKQNDIKSVKTYMYRSYRFIWFLGIPLCLGLIGISDIFVPWFFGEGFSKVSDLMKVLAFLILAIGINNITGVQYFIPTERQNTFTFTVIIGSVVNLGLNILLIPTYKALGAAVASVFAESVIAILQIYLVRQELDWREIVRGCFLYIFAGLIMLIFLRLENKFFSPSLSHIALMIVSGALLYLSILFVFHDSFFMEQSQNTIHQIKRNILNEKKAS